MMQALPFILKLVAENLSFFSFEGGFTQERFKRFSELAIFYHYASQHPLAKKAPENKIIKGHLANKISLLSADDIFRNFYTSYHIIMPYVFIRHFKKVAAHEAALNIICENHFFSPEIPPHRQMEWDYTLYKAGRKETLDYASPSILSHSCFLPFLDRELAYAITHALFYLTDFGFAGTKPPVTEIDKLAHRIAWLVARYCGEKDVDVTLELAIAYLALYPHMKNRKQANILWQEIAALVQGLLEHTAFLYIEAENEEALDSVLQKKYHTLFVLGILETLAQKRKCTLDGQAEQKPNSLLVASQILTALKKKDYPKELYQHYTKHFGRNNFLETEIQCYLNIYLARNQAGILWQQEFSALNVTKQQQKSLTTQAEQSILEKLTFDNV